MSPKTMIAGLMVGVFVVMTGMNRVDAQEDRYSRRELRMRRDGTNDNETMKEATKKIEDQAKQIGSWDNQATIIQDAHANIFRKYGWNSESDQFTLGLINDISRVEPWNVKGREQIFMNAMQGRYGLTQDQRTLVQDEMRRESMAVTRKYFTDLMPVAMEIIQTRARQEPFTAEQVQNWADKLEPVLKDGMNSVERISKKLESTMTPSQRETLAKDMKEVLKRQRDVERMMDDWRAGKWNPSDWGLDNDPIHAAAMAEHIRRDQDKSIRVPRLPVAKPKFDSISRNQSDWEKFVQWFCDYYECTPEQRTRADVILKSSTKQALDYLASRQKDIDEAIRLSKDGDSQAKRDFASGEVTRLQKPIQEIFDELCIRLEKTILTSQQLAKKGPLKKAPDAAPAAKEKSNNPPPT